MTTTVMIRRDTGGDSSVLGQRPLNFGVFATRRQHGGQPNDVLDKILINFVTEKIVVNIKNALLSVTTSLFYDLIFLLKIGTCF